MAIEKLGGIQGSEYKFYCDGICGDYIICNDDFYSSLEELKNNGWETKKNGQDWEHFCPSCSVERNK